MWSHTDVLHPLQVTIYILQYSPSMLVFFNALLGNGGILNLNSVNKHIMINTFYADDIT